MLETLTIAGKRKAPSEHEFEGFTADESQCGNRNVGFTLLNLQFLFESVVFTVYEFWFVLQVTLQLNSSITYSSKQQFVIELTKDYLGKLRIFHFLQRFRKKPQNFQ